MALPAVDGRQYVYRVHAPVNALLADLFWEAWHCHDEGPHPARATSSTRRSYAGSADDPAPLLPHRHGAPHLSCAGRRAGPPWG
ncbi:hypothetical protein GCM10009535_12910 [Streptomyces thermocarboxydovorans]|uniref:Uncharacterized protein n=1 Tax=Streptomyces thermocarboxydovorans TaxID=59298 RepID=A0ABN1HCC3_9ACTN